MFNLLPKQEKEAIRREYRVRLVTVTLWFSCVTFLIASALLLPSYFLSAQKHKAATARVETLSKTVKAGEASKQDEVLAAAKKQLNLLGREAPKIYGYELVERIASDKPTGIELRSITVSDASEGKKEVYIEGIARDRSSLVAFSRTLQGMGLFESVELPVPNFAKATDILFTLRATGSF